uniref:Homer scaffold protein 1 n=1 Tax=Cyprinus carpio TaxID=7962 RepID=A0A8C2B6E0_CYPCA
MCSADLMGDCAFPSCTAAVCLCVLQRAAHLQQQSARLPDRPQHQEELGSHQQTRRDRVLLLRQHAHRLPHHQPGRGKGHHQQHHHPQHDLHQNLTQVRSVGGQSGQHRVRPGLLLRGPSEQSESGSRPSFSQICPGLLTRPCSFIRLQFADKFAEFKEAARLAKERSQEKMELTSTPSQESATGDLQSPVTPENINGTNERVTPDTAFNTESRAETNAVPFPHSSTSITKHWEAELAALKGNNAKLTAALLESTANVKQWKQQLAAYQDEAERLHRRVTELECVSGQTAGVKTQKTELNQTIEELEAELKAREEELENLKEEVEKASQLQTQKDSLAQKLQETERRNAELESQLQDLEQRLETGQLESESFRKSLRSLLELLDGKIFELSELRDSLAKLMEDDSS